MTTSTLEETDAVIQSLHDAVPVALHNFGTAIDEFIEGEKRRPGTTLQGVMAAVSYAIGQTITMWIAMGLQAGDKKEVFGQMIQQLRESAGEPLTWAERTPLEVPIGTTVSMLAAFPRTDTLNRKHLKDVNRAYEKAFRLFTDASKKFLEDEKKRSPGGLAATFMVAITEAMGISLGLFVASLPLDLDRREALTQMLNIVKLTGDDALDRDEARGGFPGARKRADPKDNDKLGGEIDLPVKIDTAVASLLSRSSTPPLRLPDEMEEALKSKSELEKARERKQARELGDLLDRGRDALDEIGSWAKDSLRIERPSACSFWELRSALRSRSLLYETVTPEEHDAAARNSYYDTSIFRKAQVFMVEHDWASAFSRSDIVSEFRLPYEVCAFDLQVNGHPVVGLANEDNDGVVLHLGIKTSAAWLLTDPAHSTNGKDWKPVDDIEQRDPPGIIMRAEESPDEEPYIYWFPELIHLVGSQIAAVSVALDSEIARTDPARAPHKGELAKNPNAPLRQYHIVSLARRHRTARLPGSNPTGRHVRLHFRRGHWRHFETSKTWIKWTLVGDPDLGFLDKHYRL